MQERCVLAEEGELSDAFWNASLPQSLDTSVATSAYFFVFLVLSIIIDIIKSEGI
jgi:hypothetical protein